MHHFLLANELYDVWRCHHTTEKDFTFHSTAHNSYSRIGYFLTDKWLLKRISASTIELITWSDHAPICLTIDSSNSPNPTKLWRANTSLMKSSPYAEEIQCQIDEYFEHNVASVDKAATLWMAHKSFIRGVLMKLGSQAKKRRTQ